MLLNRPPDYCPQCDAYLVIPVPPSAINPSWDEKRDGPQHPHGWHRWRVAPTTSDIEDRGVAVLECPECFHNFEWQAWPVRTDKQDD